MKYSKCILPLFLFPMLFSSCNDEEKAGDLTINVSVANVYGNIRNYEGNTVFGRLDDEHKVRVYYQISTPGRVVEEGMALLNSIYDIFTIEESGMDDGIYYINVFTDIVETDSRGSVVDTNYSIRETVSAPGLEISSNGTLDGGRYDVCGSLSREFTVQDGTNFTVTPEAMGNLVSMYIFNAAACDYFLYTLPASFSNFTIGNSDGKNMIIKSISFDETPKSDGLDEYYKEHFLLYTDGGEQVKMDWKSSSDENISGIWLHKGNLISDVGETWRLRINAGTGDNSLLD